MALTRREDIETGKSRDLARLARMGGGSLLTTSMVIAVALIVIAISSKVRGEFDMSRQGTNRLSPQTLEVLDRLDRDVKLYALYRKEPANLREHYWNVLKRYRDASPKITAEFYDPVTRPGIVRELGLATEQEVLKTSSLTVAISGERKLIFRGEEEEDVTNALLEIGRDTTRVVGILRGYGERDPESDQPGGFLLAVEALRQEYYEVRDVSLNAGIPDDVLVLIAPGPKLSIPEADLDRLAEWLERGGRLMALLDAGEKSGLDRVLDRWGLAPTGARVFDQRENLNNDPSFVKVTTYSKVHEAVRDFGKNFPTAFPAPGTVTDYEPGDPLVFHEALASSSLFSVAIGDDGVKIPGPLDIAAASWKEEEIDGEEVVTRLVLVGNSAFASSAYLPARANRNFLLNCVGWLSRQEELISIRRQRLAGQTYVVEASDKPVVYAAVFGAPTAVILFGVVMFSGAGAFELKRLLVTAVVLLLAVTAGWIVLQREAERDSAERAEGQLLQFDDRAVEGILLTIGDTDWEMVRGETGWRITAPLQDEADEVAIQRVLTVSRIGEVDQVVEDVTDLAEFGLDPPAAILRLQGVGVPALYLGDTTPPGDGLYVRIEGRPGVLVVSRDWTRPLDALYPELFREHDVLVLRRQEIDKVTIRHRSSTIRAEREGEDWWIVEPVRIPAFAVMFDRLFAALERAEVQRFIDDEDSSAPRFGLGSDAVEITLGTPEMSRTIRLGAVEGGLRYILRDDRSAVLVAEDEPLSQLPLEITELAADRLTLVNRYKVTRFEYRKGPATLLASRGEQGWASGDGLRLDEEDVYALLVGILEARVGGWRMGAARSATPAATFDFDVEGGGSDRVEFHRGNLATVASLPDATFELKSSPPEIPPQMLR